MELLPPNESKGAYFALPRLLAGWRGRTVARSENNGTEAYLASVGIYLVSYLFAARLLLPGLCFWTSALVLLFLLAGIWIFWLLVLYLNSLIVKAIHALGLWTHLSRNRLQDVLVEIVVTAFAAFLVIAGSWPRWVGAIWIGIVVLNLMAAVLLRLRYDQPN